MWQAADCLRYRQNGKTIKPQYAIQRLYELTKDRETYITTEVGQHQMWAAQHYKFETPRHWMTSGGLGTMGYGFPAAMGVQVAHPDALVIDIAGEASWVMNMQEMSTIVAVPPAGEVVHPQQQLHGHGPAVAGVLPRQPLQRELHGQPARLREAGRGVRRRRAARRDPIRSMT